jgi:hypothetical protein
VSEAWFTAQAFQGAPKEARPFPWVDKKLACIIKGLKKGSNAFDPPDNYYSRRNMRRRCRHWRNAFVELFVR